MRFKIQTPNIGDIKIIKRFLWFPIKIEKEIRWLEFIKEKYVYRSHTYWNSYSSNTINKWETKNIWSFIEYVE